MKKEHWLCLLALNLGSIAFAKVPLSGGETSIVIDPQQSSSRNAFSLPAANLSLTRRNKFFVGNSFFRNPWVTAPASTEARDGLGPVFNANSCQSCHIRDGRGKPPLTKGEEMLSMLVRISMPPKSPLELMKNKDGVIPHPVYGAQLQNNSILGIFPEAKPDIEWEYIKGKYEDGKSYTLRKPKLSFRDPGYGEIPNNLQASLRVAPVMIGVGLLDTITEESLRELEDPEDEDGNGISGRLNRVWDREKKDWAPGRFGWKAEEPNVRQQTAGAFSGDIGITSSLFPVDLFTEEQKKTVNPPHGGVPEVSDEILDFVTFYSKNLAVPARRSHDNAFIQKGEELFKSVGCADCHVDHFITGNDPEFPELSNQEIHPYTDLLLHDMGEGLADNRPVYSASGREWRTPPLWGIGLVKLVNQHTNFLHDGRARSLEEAILWHGGEAQASRDAFVSMSAEERRQIVAFLNSL